MNASGRKPRHIADPFKEIDALREALEFTNQLVQTECAEVESICRLALACLEDPAGEHHLPDAINAMKALAGKAAQLREHVGAEAAHAGCVYTSPAFCGGGGAGFYPDEKPQSKQSLS